MKTNRRKFLKFAGASALGLGTALNVSAAFGQDAVVNAPGYEPSPEALKAKHWAMVIDTRQFESPEDFEPIIEACHSLHNVPSGIPRNQGVKWIWTDTFHHTFIDQPNHYLAEGVEEKAFLLLCNHCENPACTRVCPTKATFKRESDGIVVMDFHRCIGCRFCMAACPYGARSFNFRDPRPFIAKENPEFPTRMRGVVEKCNFCSERLGAGLMPACVEASGGKMLFGDLADPESEIRHALRENFSIMRNPALGTAPSVYYLI